jgi:hypothetical protein
MNLEKPTGYATPFKGQQAPDNLALGFTTNLELESEQKYYPFAKFYGPPQRANPTGNQIPLPKFPMGVIPTLNRQQYSELDDRGFPGPMVNYNGSMISADLAEAFVALTNKGKMVPAPLSDAYQGSPWMYGPFNGLPHGTTNGTNFVLEYQDVLRESELHRRADKLIREGYDAKRVMKVLEEAVDNTIREKLKHR